MPSFVCGMSFYSSVGGSASHDVLVQHRRDREHLTGTFAIRSGNDRGVDVLESTLLEEQVRGKRAAVADTRHSGDLLLSWAGMRTVFERERR